MLHARFRDRVRHDAGGDATGVDRTDVDDAARTLGGDQASRRFLRDQPAAIEIGLHHRRPVVVGVVEHAPGCGHTGVVDDEIERTAFVAGLIQCAMTLARWPTSRLNAKAVTPVSVIPSTSFAKLYAAHAP